MEDQLTTWIAAGVSFLTGWVLDNGIPRKVAKFVVSLIAKKRTKMEAWLIIGPIAVAAVGWFIGSEIHTLRKRFDRIEQTQTQMAVTLARLEEKVK